MTGKDRKGFIIDLDYARRKDDLSGRKSRTGTPAFMALNTLQGLGCATLLRDLEGIFAVLCWVATFAGAPTSKKLTKSSVKLAKVYKPGSPIGPVMQWSRQENQIQPINDWNKGDYQGIYRAKKTHLSSSDDFNKSIVNHFASDFRIDIGFRAMLEHCRHKIYDDLPRPVIQLNVDPVEHIDAISAEIMKMKQRKEFESLDMSQLKRLATIEIVEQIQRETYQCEQVQIEEKHEQQIYHDVMGFIDQYLQSKGHVSNGVDVLKEIDMRAESEASDLIERQSLLRI